MPDHKPYKDNYFSQKKNKNLTITGIMILILAFAAILFLTRNDKQNKVKPNVNMETDQSVKKETLLEKEKKSSTPAEAPSAKQIEINQNLSFDYQEKDNDLPIKKNELPGSEPQNKRNMIIKRAQPEEWFSNVDREREKGVMVFEDVIRQCSETRERIKQLQSEYNSTCLGTTYDAFGNVINLSSTKKCRQLITTINSLKIEIEKNLELAQYHARKSGVYPGQIREILSKYGFDDH